MPGEDSFADYSTIHMMKPTYEPPGGGNYFNDTTTAPRVGGPLDAVTNQQQQAADPGTLGQLLLADIWKMSPQQMTQVLSAAAAASTDLSGYGPTPRINDPWSTSHDVPIGTGRNNQVSPMLLAVEGREGSC